MRVFKYRGGAFKRDLEALIDNYFWAPTRKGLNDPYEGLYDDESINQQLDFNFKDCSEDIIEDVKSALKELFEFVDKSGIYSLSRNPLDELLWAHYASCHTGFCVEYDIGKLTENEQNDYICINVQYKKAPQTMSVSDIDTGEQKKLLMKMFGIKSKLWGYEKETRLITAKSGKHDYDFCAVKAIYFGLRMLDEEKNIIMDSLKGRKIKYHQIILKPKTYKFSSRLLQDPYKEAKEYK